MALTQSMTGAAVRKLARELDRAAAVGAEALVGGEEGGDVGPPEAVDRLLRVADEEEVPGGDLDATPSGRSPPTALARVGGRDAHGQLDLDGVGVLELVEQQPLVALVQTRSARPRRAPGGGAGRGRRTSRSWNSSWPAEPALVGRVEREAADRRSRRSAQALATCGAQTAQPLPGSLRRGARHRRVRRPALLPAPRRPTLKLGGRLGPSGSRASRRSSSSVDRRSAAPRTAAIWSRRNRPACRPGPGRARRRLRSISASTGASRPRTGGGSGARPGTRSSTRSQLSSKATASGPQRRRTSRRTPNNRRRVRSSAGSASSWSRKSDQRRRTPPRSSPRRAPRPGAAGPPRSGARRGSAGRTSAASRWPRRRAGRARAGSGRPPSAVGIAVGARPRARRGCGRAARRPPSR